METICGFKIHRFVKLFPSMTEEEYQDLKEDIKLNGQALSTSPSLVWCNAA